jgi:hypothetical protein
MIAATANPAPLPLLLRWRAARTFTFVLRTIRYSLTLGPRQICWLVESLEHRHGHLASRAGGLPVDEAGRPLPWYTYPAIQFLSQIDLSERTAFEFGSGNSSLFWADKVRRLTSLESDPEWHGRISPGLQPNQQLLLEEDLERYPQRIHDAGLKYDLIVVDGKRRRACATEAIACLAKGGMIVLDNADWHPKTAALLRDAGLIQIDFSGFGPINNYTWTTSLFLRRDADVRPRFDRLPQPPIASLVQTVEE